MAPPLGALGALGSAFGQISGLYRTTTTGMPANTGIWFNGNPNIGNFILEAQSNDMLKRMPFPQPDVPMKKPPSPNVDWLRGRVNEVREWFR